MRTTIEDVFALAMVCVLLFILGSVVWDFTGRPMMRNHAECGTIFLCRNQG